jgi:hypothetical protein
MRLVILMLALAGPVCAADLQSRDAYLHRQPNQWAFGSGAVEKTVRLDAGRALDSLVTAPYLSGAQHGTKPNIVKVVIADPQRYSQETNGPARRSRPRPVRSILRLVR